MKKTVLGIATVLMLMICPGVFAVDMPALAKKYECNGCHEIDKLSVGPAWMDISRRYRGVAQYTYGGREYALEEGLVMKVSLGGSGNWGAMPMPPNDPKGQSQADMKRLVRFVLKLAK